jgi:hypothetical protein
MIIYFSPSLRSGASGRGFALLLRYAQKSFLPQITQINTDKFNFSLQLIAGILLCQRVMSLLVLFEAPVL